MGNQTSFISTNRNRDIDKVIDLFKKYNLRTVNDDICSCTAKIILNKQITTTVDEVWGTVGNNQTFKKGKQFLVIEGERCGQRSIGEMFDMNNVQYTDRELDLIYRIEIIFMDYFPYDKVFDEKYITTIELDI